MRGILPELNGNKAQQCSRCGDTTAIGVVDGMNLAVVAAGHLFLKVELLAVWYTKFMHEVLLSTGMDGVGSIPGICLATPCCVS